MSADIDALYKRAKAILWVEDSDPAALEGCRLNTGRRTSADIEGRLSAVAKERVWWIACTRFLADTRQKATDGYPPDPRTISSLTDAEAHIKASTWFQRTAAQCPALAEPAAVSAALKAAHTDATEALADMSWKRRFPGKQLFREISGYVFQNGKGRSARIDLIKAVGTWQSGMGWQMSSRASASGK